MKFYNRGKARLKRFLGVQNNLKGFNICVVRVDGDRHYRVFDELAESIHFSLIECNVSSQWGYNQIDYARHNIVLGLHLLSQNQFELLPEPCFLVNTEQMASVRESWRELILSYFQGNHHRVDYSTSNVDWFISRGFSNVRLLRLGYQSELHRLVMRDRPDVDVLFYGTLNERRQRILHEMREQGLVVESLYGVYGEDRDKFISRAKIVLNLHFYDAQILEVVRLFYLEINRILVLTERNPETRSDHEIGENCIAVPYLQLVGMAVRLCGDDALRDRIRSRCNKTGTIKKQSEFSKEVFLDEK